MSPLAAILLLPIVAAPADGFPITMRDAQEVRVTLARAPQRIVSMAPSTTESLFAIGLAQRVVGVTNFCNYPEEAKTKPKVGGYVNLSVEKVISLSPDLVVGTRGTSLEAIKQLRDLGVKVFMFDAMTLDQVLGSVTTLGRLTGHTAPATQVVESFRTTIASIQKQLGDLSEEQKPRVYFGSYKPPFFSPGTGTFLHDLVVLAGGRNIAAGAPIRWPQLSMEQIVAKNPDIIVCAFQPSEGMWVEDNTVGDRFRERREWQQINAVRNGRIHVASDDMFLRPTPRLQLALEMLAAWFHPDRFVNARRSDEP